MNRRILLLEPNYKNKFPPIGLMKIATYFRICGDEVVFYKGDLVAFVVNQITNECIKHLQGVDTTIDWSKYFDNIAHYIRYRRRDDIETIGTLSFISLGWLEYYKDYFHKGEYKQHPQWDWVFVTTLFTFYWDITIETIEFAKTQVKDLSHLMVGGVLASIQPDEIERATGIRPHVGTLKPGDIDPDNDLFIDELPLDYSILEEIDYVYPDKNAYYGYSTRGCIRKCPFCAVWKIEPQYIDYLPLQERIKQTGRLYGERRNLLLMDNNVLASEKLEDIITDIQSCGFTNENKYVDPNEYKLAIRNLRLHINDRAYIRKAFNLLYELNNWKSLREEERLRIYTLREGRKLVHLTTCTRENLIDTYKDFAPYFEKRYKKQKGCLRVVDFNQGVDARLFNEHVVELLARIPINPLRIAFDDMKTEPQYRRALELSVKGGIKHFSNYLLYNFHDTPIDLYHRLRINVDLCEQWDVTIYSFPMKYHPIVGEYSHNRDFIGEYWNRKYIRAVQAILNATKGKIGRGKSFFEKAFGRNENEFMELLLMPETFIIYRLEYERNGYTKRWREAINNLSSTEKEELYPLIYKNDFRNITTLTVNEKYLKVLQFYTLSRTPTL